MACALFCHQIYAQADGHKETERRTGGLGWSQKYTKGGEEGGLLVSSVPSMSTRKRFTRAALAAPEVWTAIHSIVIVFFVS